MADVRAGAASVLVPHSGTALLLGEVLQHAEGFIEARGCIPAAHPLVQAGRAPCFLGLDLGAQAAAALEALARRAAGDARPRIGNLVRVRAASFARADLPVEVPLTVTARATGAAPPLAIYEVGVSLQEAVVLRATLSTYLTEVPPVA